MSAVYVSLNSRKMRNPSMAQRSYALQPPRTIIGLEVSEIEHSYHLSYNSLIHETMQDKNSVDRGL